MHILKKQVEQRHSRHRLYHYHRARNRGDLGTVRHLYIAEHDGTPAGYVRFEDNHLGEPEISVYLAPSCRGRRLSAPLINDGTRHHLALHPDPRPMTAWVRIENAPSLAAFRSAGWHPDPTPAPYLTFPAYRFVFPA